MEATSFSPILPEAAAAVAAAAASAENATGTPAAPAQPSAADVAAIGSYLYAQLNYLFRHHPLIDELGLVLAVPPAGGKKKKGAAATTPTSSEGAASNSSSSNGAAAAASASSDDDLDSCARFANLHAAPPALLALQSSNCPPFVVMEDSKLGIAFWCIPLLVRFTMMRFQRLRKQLRTDHTTPEQMATTCEKALVDKGADSVDDLLAGVSSSLEAPLPLPVDLACCTRVLLLINADNYTAWNIRKQLLSMPALTIPPASVPAVSAAAASPAPACRRFLLSPSLELRFLNLVYSKHPKSGESWSHRRWVLSRIKGYESRYHFGGKSGADVAEDAASAETADAVDAPSSSLYTSPLFQSELAMCERSAELYPKNYYAWMHRAWLVELLGDPRSDLEAELDRIGGWTESHINDYCGFFHRSVVWNQVLQSFTQSEKAAKAAGRKLTKGEQYAVVHVNLRDRLRSWSQKFPSSELQSVPATTAAAAAVSPSAVAAPASPSSSSSSSLHAALASCSFCSLFSSLEWSHLNDLQCKYPGHESLWMYRRFVWHTFVESIAEHAAVAEGTGNSAVASSGAAPAIPSWLLPLVQRELSYADFQIADLELSNYADNARFAAVYKVWVLHAALTLVYRSRIETASAATTPQDASFPLFRHLIPAHRTWYLSMLQAVNKIQPQTMQRNHWKDRTDACSNDTNQTNKV